MWYARNAISRSIRSAGVTSAKRSNAAAPFRGEASVWDVLRKSQVSRIRVRPTLDAAANGRNTNESNLSGITKLEKEWKENEYEHWFKAVAQIGGVAIQGECDTDWFLDTDEKMPKSMVENFIADLKKGIKWLEEVKSADYNVTNFISAINTAEEYLAAF